MTFLLFLASVLAMEYLIRREPSPKRREPKLPTHQSRASPVKPLEQPVGGLAALGNALDLYGRGDTPGTVVDDVEASTNHQDRVS